MFIKNSININQRAVVENGWELDIVDMAIFEYIRGFVLSKKCNSIQTNSGTYFIIGAQGVIDALPLVGIKTKRGINQRISKLINVGLVEKCEDSQIMSQTLIRLGKEFDAYEYYNTEEETPIARKFQGCEQNDTPWNENSKPLGTEIPSPWNENSKGTQYKGIIDRNNIDNNSLSSISPKVDISDERVSSKPKGLDYLKEEEAVFEPIKGQKIETEIRAPQPPTNDVVEVDVFESQEELKAAQQKEEENKDKADITNYTAFAEYWNKKTNGVFGILRGIDGKRREMLRTRIREYGRKAFDEALTNALQSNFLKGQNDRGWKMNFDWFIKPTNFQKVLENNYQNKDNNGFSQEEYRQRAVREAANAVQFGGRVGGVTYGNAYSTLLAERERVRRETETTQSGGFI